MHVRRPSYSKHELARRARDIYDRLVAPTLGIEDEGSFITIDVESQAFRIDRDGLTGGDELIDINPDAQLFMVRSGFQPVARVGGKFASQV